MSLLKNKRAQDLKNKLQTQIAKYNSQLNAKKSFRQNQITSLKRKYNAKSNDLVPQLENIVAANIYIAAVTEILNNLRLLHQNPELLVDSKKLPSEIQIALEYCNALAKVDKQPDLHNLIKGLMDKHKALTDISITHDTYVYFGSEQITHEDVEKYYPEIKHECNLVEDQYLANALSKYSDLIVVSVQSSPMPLFQPQLYPNMPQNQLTTQNLTQPPLYATQNLLQQPPQFTTQTIQQAPQFTSQNLQQPPQFTPQNLQQPPQFTPQNLQQPPQFTPQNLQQPPQFTPQNLQQPPQFTPQGTLQQPQYTTQNLQQPPQFTPPNTPQQSQFTTQTLQQSPQFTTQNLQQQSQSNAFQSPYASSDSQPSPQPPQNQNSSTEDAYQPPFAPPPFVPPPFAPPPASPPQLSEVAGNMAYPQVPIMSDGQNEEGGN